METDLLTNADFMVSELIAGYVLNDLFNFIKCCHNSIQNSEELDNQRMLLNYLYQNSESKENFVRFFSVLLNFNSFLLKTRF